MAGQVAAICHCQSWQTNTHTLGKRCSLALDMLSLVKSLFGSLERLRMLRWPAGYTPALGKI